VRVAIGSDHAGFALKETIKALLDELKLPYEDFGTSSPVAVDSPDVAEAVSRAVVGGRADRGILVCGTGIGMSMAANKIADARTFLSTDYEGGRHGRRLEKIARLERRDA
jgi:ribose 5-phosphate isomerase B